VQSDDANDHGLNQKNAGLPASPKEFDTALRNCTDSLYRLIHEAVTRARAKRLYKAICSFRQAEPISCDVCGGGVNDLRGFFVLGECGHGVCKHCLKVCCDDGNCGYTGCNASALRDRVVKYDDLGHDEGLADHDDEESDLSRKNAELVRLLKQIPDDEHALLFIQFPELLAEAKAALDEAGIAYSSIASQTSDEDDDENDEDNQNVGGKGKKMSTSKAQPKRKAQRKGKKQNKDDSSDEEEEEQAEFQAEKSRVVILTLGDVTASGL
jgi:hypothetical protein